MLRVMYAVFFIECAYASYLTVYALVYQIPSTGSIIENILQLKHWDPYELHWFAKNVLTSIYILIICSYLYRDHKNPDAYNHGVSEEQKRAVAQLMLEQHRVKLRKKREKRKKQGDPK